jgi:hypothetical protein
VDVWSVSVNAEAGEISAATVLSGRRESCAAWDHSRSTAPLVVGPSDVLANSMAFFGRSGVRHAGRRPLSAAADHAGRHARILVDAAQASGDAELDAAGPDTMSFADYVRLVARACGERRLIVGLPAPLVLAALRLLELWLDDVVLTREELLGLRQELLISRKPALGREPDGAWLLENGSSLGRVYVNDVQRHFAAGAIDPVLNPALAGE